MLGRYVHVPARSGPRGPAAALGSYRIAAAGWDGRALVGLAVTALLFGTIHPADPEAAAAGADSCPIHVETGPASGGRSFMTVRAPTARAAAPPGSH